MKLVLLTSGGTAVFGSLSQNQLSPQFDVSRLGRHRPFDVLIENAGSVQIVMLTFAREK